MHYNGLANCLLHAGRLLMHNGAPTERTQKTLIRMGEHLGYKNIHVAVAYDHILLTLGDGQAATVHLESLGDLGANFSIISAVTELCHELETKAYTLETLKKKLESIEKLKAPCPFWLTCVLAGIGCACVGQIFGADLGGAMVDFIAAFAGCLSLFIFGRPSISPYITTTIAATISGIVVNLLAFLGYTQTPFLVISASVLYLVPGVPMISGFIDILLGQIPTGLARLANMLFVSLAIALGLLLSSFII